MALIVVLRDGASAPAFPVPPNRALAVPEDQKREPRTLMLRLGPYRLDTTAARITPSAMVFACAWSGSVNPIEQTKRPQQGSRLTLR
jgi:hypothetical protein